MSALTEKMEWVKGVVTLAKVYAKRIVLIVAVVLVILAILKVSILLGLYFFFSNLIAEATGLDHSYVRSLSILSVVCTLMAAPTILGWLTFKGDKKKVAIIAIVFTAVTMGIVKYKSDHIFFDSTTGKALSYYVKTPVGYKFTVDADKKYDPTFGIAYLPVTKDVVLNFTEESARSENEAIVICIILTAIVAIIAWCCSRYIRYGHVISSSKKVLNENKDSYVFIVNAKEGELEFSHKSCCGGDTKFKGSHLECDRCGFSRSFTSYTKADFLAAAYQVAEKGVVSKPLHGWTLLPSNHVT